MQTDFTDKCQILCTTKEDVDNLFSFLDGLGITWVTGRSLSSTGAKYTYLPCKYVHIGYWDNKNDYGVSHGGIHNDKRDNGKPWDFDGDIYSFMDFYNGSKCSIVIDDYL